MLDQRFNVSEYAVDAAIGEFFRVIGLEAVGQRGFANLHVVIRCGQDQVGDDALFLGGATGDTVEFRHRELELAGVGQAHPVVERHDGLHAAFAVGGQAADEERPAVVLQRRGDDLGGGGTELADEDNHRAVVADLGVVVLQDLFPTPAVDDLHDGALVDEQAGQLDGLGQQAATVAPEVKHDAGDLFFFETIQNQ